MVYFPSWCFDANLRTRTQLVADYIRRFLVYNHWSFFSPLATPDHLSRMLLCFSTSAIRATTSDLKATPAGLPTTSVAVLATVIGGVSSACRSRTLGWRDSSLMVNSSFPLRWLAGELWPCRVISMDLPSPPFSPPPQPSPPPLSVWHRPRRTKVFFFLSNIGLRKQFMVHPNCLVTHFKMHL